MSATTKHNIDEELADSLTDRGIEQWWSARNRYLGGARPIELLAEHPELVREAAAAFVDGVYL